MDKPSIIVIDLKTEYSAAGKPVEWVKIAPAHDPLGTHTWHRVADLQPPEGGIANDDEGNKIGYMTARWKQIEPAYEAWKAGSEIPLDGVPLAAWNGVTREQAEVLKARGIKTVEGVRDITDSQFSKIMLPNMRQLRDLARDFLENREASAAAAKIAAKDEQIDAMQAQMDEMAAMLADLTKPKPASKSKDKDAA
jgi:hypothetical protein